MQNAAPQPTLEHLVRDIHGKRIRVIVFSGVVSVAPAQQRGIVVRTTPEQPAAPIGFYVPEAFGIVVDGAIAVAEAILDPGRRRRPNPDGRQPMGSPTSRCVWSSRNSHPGSAGRISASSCHSNDLPLGVHYRVTIQHPLVSENPARPAGSGTGGSIAERLSCQLSGQERFGGLDDAVIAEALGSGDHGTVEIRDSRPPVEMRRTPVSPSWVTLGPPGRINTFTGTPTAPTTARDLIEVAQPRRGHDLGSCTDIRLQPGDGVVEVVACRAWFSQRAVSTNPVSARAGGGSARPLDGHIDRIDRVGQRVPSSIEQPQRPGLGKQLDGLGDAGHVFGEAALGVDVQGQIGGRRQWADMCRATERGPTVHVEAPERARRSRRWSMPAPVKPSVASSRADPRSYGFGITKVPSVWSERNRSVDVVMAHSLPGRGCSAGLPAGVRRAPGAHRGARSPTPRCWWRTSPPRPAVAPTR